MFSKQEWGAATRDSKKNINNLFKLSFENILLDKMSQIMCFPSIFLNKKAYIYADCSGFSTLQCSAITVSGDAARDSHSTLQTRHETQPEQRAHTVI